MFPVLLAVKGKAKPDRTDGLQQNLKIIKMWKGTNIFLYA